MSFVISRYMHGFDVCKTAPSIGGYSSYSWADAAAQNTDAPSFGHDPLSSIFNELIPRSSYHQASASFFMFENIIKLTR